MRQWRLEAEIDADAKFVVGDCLFFGSIVEQSVGSSFGYFNSGLAFDRI